jgi:hypothetical protein
MRTRLRVKKSARVAPARRCRSRRLEQVERLKCRPYCSKVSGLPLTLAGHAGHARPTQILEGRQRILWLAVSRATRSIRGCLRQHDDAASDSGAPALPIVNYESPPASRVQARLPDPVGVGLSPDARSSCLKPSRLDTADAPRSAARLRDRTHSAPRPPHPLNSPSNCPNTRPSPSGSASAREAHPLECGAARLWTSRGGISKRAKAPSSLVPRVEPELHSTDCALACSKSEAASTTTT